MIQSLNKRHHNTQELFQLKDNILVSVPILKTNYLS